MNATMKKPVRILMLVENNAYPFDVRVRREATALHEAGYDVAVIAPHADGQPWSETINGVKVHRFPAPPGGAGLLSYAAEFLYATLAMLVVALKVFFKHGFDVIHAANPPDTLFVVAAVFKPFGVKFVFDHHDLAPETYLSRFQRPKRNAVYWALRLLERCTFALADLVIATNESYKGVAMARGRKRAEQVYVVRNGPPLTFKPTAPDAALAARAPNLIGYIGTMGPQDGVDYWLRALHELVFTLKRKDVLAVVIGDGDAMPHLRALAKELSLEPYVWFTGRVTDKEVLSYLSTVQVCVQPDPLNPLNDKSTMNKVMEYMALGKPIVAFDLCETRRSAQEAAIYAPPNDVLEFAKKVLWLMDNPAERERMGEIGRMRVMSSLAWDHSAPRLVQAYAEGLSLQAGKKTADSLQ